MRLTFLLGLSVLLASPIPAGGEPAAHAKHITARVERVHSGDTVTIVTEDLKESVVRLYGIDAPEVPGGRGRPGQPEWKKARIALEKKTLRKDADLEVRGSALNPPAVGVLWVDGQCINREMVKEGLAWAYRDGLAEPYASEYIDAEKVARKDRLGIWAHDRPEPPWEYRKRTEKRGKP